MKKILAISILICLFFCAPLYARIYIDITAPIMRRIPVDLTPLELVHPTFENRMLARELMGVLAQDLEFHGFFKVYTPKETPLEEVMDYEIKGRLRREDERLRVELMLFDARTHEMLTGRRYKGGKDAYTLRRMAHRFTDLVVRQITGEGGVSLSKIAFVAEKNGRRDVYLADFDGNNLKQVTRDGAIKLSPRISPDGSLLVFTSYRAGKPFLYISSILGTHLRRLTGFEGINISPAWHPKGKVLAVTLSKDGNPDLYLVDLSGQVMDRLTRGPGINCSPSWAPDGRRIVFVSDRYGTPQLFVMDVSRKTVERLTYTGKYNTDPSWSPRGDRIAYVSRVDGRFQVFTISPDGGDPVQLTYSGNNENPSWSPDGRQILFSSDRLGKKALYVMDANGRRQRRIITIRSGDALTPFWGPNTFK